MKKEDRNTFLLIAIILVACIVALVAIFNIMWSIIADPVRTAVNEIYVFADGTDVSPLDNDFTANYNFEVPEPQQPIVEGNNYRSVINALKMIIDEQEDLTEIQEEPIGDETNQLENDQNQDEEIGPEDAVNYDYNFLVPEREVPEVDIEFAQSIPDAIVQDATLAGYGQGDSEDTQVNLQIRIPKIGVNSPVVQGLGADDLLEKGFWVHPGSYELGEGEVTMLCHRRFFGPYDPRSCWFLDELTQGDEIILDFFDTTLEYRVVGVNVFDGEDPLIYTFAEGQDYIKIVTCTPLFSNEQRLVVLAERV